MRCAAGWWLTVAVLLIALGGPGLSPAEGLKGAIEGRVVDERGSALNGVAVSLTSPAMPGGVSLVTGVDGRFRCVRLAPGRYLAVFSLRGREEVELERLEVGIGGTVRLEVTLRPEQGGGGEQEPLPVPVQPRSSPATGLDLDRDLLRNLPVARDYASVARVSPGVWTDAVGLAVYGSSGAENAYSIDGLDTTDLELGLQGTSMPVEFIHRVRVTTAAYAAEHGRSTGGLVDAVTRSGGNDLHGEVFGFWDDDSLRADPRRVSGSGPTRVTDASRADYGADLGGLLRRDRLWFFVAYDRVDRDATRESMVDYGAVLPGATSRGQRFSQSTTGDLYVGKLSWRPAPQHSLSASLFGDPTGADGILPGASLAATPLTFYGTVEGGGDDAVIDYGGVLGERVVLTARVGTHRQRRRQGGPGASVPAYVDFTDPLGDGTVVWGWEGRESGFGAFTNQELRRDQVRLGASFLVDDLAGQHELEVGVEVEDVAATSHLWNGGAGQRIYRFVCNPSVRYCGAPGEESPYYYRHRFYLASQFVDPQELTPDDVLAPLTVRTGAETSAAYIQDRWQPSARLTLDVGLRWEAQRLSNSDQDVRIDVDDAWAPRLGFVWDVAGNGRTTVFGHVGRFTSVVPLSTVNRALGGQLEIYTYNLSDDPDDVANDPHVRASRVLIDPFLPADPDLEAESMSEVVLGAAHQVLTDLSLGITIIRRDLERVIEDGIGGDGLVYLGNPGEGVLQYTYDLAYAYGYECPGGGRECHRHRMPLPERRFEGIEITAHKRLSNRFQVIASVLLSRLRGNYDGTYQASTGHLDPHLSSAYAYYDFSVNGHGDLAGDRRVQARFDGVYRFDWGLTAGLSAFFRSGVPVTAMGYSAAFDDYLYLLSRRGAFGRTAAEYQADLHLGYPVRLGGEVELELLADVFNLLDRQGETGRDMRYSFAEVYQPLDWPTGLPNPPIVPGEPERPPTNPSFNAADSWQAPRAIRLGARVSF